MWRSIIAHTESSCDVILRPLFLRVLKDLVGLAELDQLAHIKEGGAIRNAAACCMLWVTMTMVYCFFQFRDQFLDFHRRDRIERGSRLVHEQHFRFHRHRARDAKALLLPAGKAHPGLVQVVLHFVPERGHAEGFLEAFVEKRAVPRRR